MKELAALLYRDTLGYIILGSVVELASALRSYEVGCPPLRSELAWLVLHSIPLLALVPNEFAEFDNTWVDAFRLSPCCDVPGDSARWL